jgi:hypothetical protein
VTTKNRNKMWNRILSDELACWSEGALPSFIHTRRNQTRPRCWCGHHLVALECGRYRLRIYDHPDDLPAWRDQCAEILNAVDAGRLK